MRWSTLIKKLFKKDGSDGGDGNNTLKSPPYSQRNTADCKIYGFHFLFALNHSVSFKIVVLFEQ